MTQLQRYNYLRQWIFVKVGACRRLAASDCLKYAKESMQFDTPFDDCGWFKVNNQFTIIL